jgi:hypothetical protein
VDDWMRCSHPIIIFWLIRKIEEIVKEKHIVYDSQKPYE